MATIKTKKVKTTSKKKKVTPKIEVNTRDEWITIFNSASAGDFRYTLDYILELANEHKPKDYPQLAYEDISIYLDTDIDYGYYNDVCATVTLEISIKNKDYKKK